MDTIGKKIRDLEQLKKELEELDLAAEVLTPGRLAEDATLLVCLPSVDEVPDDLDDIESEDLHLASGMLVDLDDTGKSFARYLIFYSQIRVKLENPDEQRILKMVNFMNRTSRVGHYFYGRRRAGAAGAVSGNSDRGIWRTF